MTEQVITKQKETALALRWLQLATAGKDRPILSGMHVENGRAATTDGFRIHWAPTPTPLAHRQGEIVRIRDGKALHKSPGRVYEAETIEGNYPDLDQVDPDRGGHHPQAVIAVNPKYLREALEMPQDGREEKSIVLRIYSSTSPFTVTRPDDQYKAVIMPRHLTADSKAEKQAAECDNDYEGLRDLARTLDRIIHDDYLDDQRKVEKIEELTTQALT